MLKNFFNQGKLKKEKELEALESQLFRSITSVDPRPEFVNGLKRRLDHYSNSVEVVSPRKKPQVQKALTGAITADVLLGALGVLSGAALLVVGIRAFIAVIAAFGLARQIKSGLTPKTFTLKPNS